MAFAHIVVFSAALVTLLGVPCAVTAVRRADNQARRRRWQPDPSVTIAYRELDRAMLAASSPVTPPPATPDPAGDSIDEIAHDLRRLNERRLAEEPPFWLDRAYDTKLCLACHCLGLHEHLAPLVGLDREIERVRVEGVLEAAGLTLR